MIVEKIIANINERHTDGKIIDRILMDHHDLTKPHQKVKSESGQIIAISLEHGENLAPGSILYEDEERIVAIDLLPEDVLRIVPNGNIEWGRAAFNIGNMHQAAYIHKDCILVAYDAIMEGIIKKLGIKCERVECKLEGIRANVSQTDAHHYHHHGDHHHE